MVEVWVKKFLLLVISYWPYEAASSRGFCYISMTKDELARKLWGTSSNYSKSKFTRPNLAKLIAENPMARPDLAEVDIVKIGINLMAVKVVDDMRNEIVLELVVNQYWNDYRLQYETGVNCYGDEQEYYEIFEMVDFASIWKPEIHVKNLVEKPIDLKGEFYVYPNGNVKFRQESLFTLSCKIDIMFLPYDTQRCHIVIASASETSNVSLIYYDIPITNHKSDSIADTLEWNMEDYGPKSDNYNPDAQSSLAFSMDFKRLTVGYYEEFVIIPVILMVAFGWASFFVSRTNVPARVGMNNVGFLAITNLVGQRLSYFPRIGAKDAYILKFMMISLIFSSYCIIQFIFVNYLTRVERRTDKTYELAKKAKHKKMIEKMDLRNSKCHEFRIMNLDIDPVEEVENFEPSRDDMQEIGIHKIDFLMLKRDGTMRFKDQHIDILSRYIFPIAYIIMFLVFHVRWSSG